MVECDGSDFHDATVEQLVRDRRRDRRLQAMGFNVFRYSGSEIWRDVFASAREVTDFLGWALEQRLEAEARKKPQRENGGPIVRAATMS